MGHGFGARVKPAHVTPIRLAAVGAAASLQVSTKPATPDRAETNAHTARRRPFAFGPRLARCDTPPVGACWFAGSGFHSALPHVGLRRAGCLGLSVLTGGDGSVPRSGNWLVRSVDVWVPLGSAGCRETPRNAPPGLTEASGRGFLPPAAGAAQRTDPPCLDPEGRPTVGKSRRTCQRRRWGWLH